VGDDELQGGGEDVYGGADKQLLARFFGRRGTTRVGEACGTLGWDGGGRSTSVDDELTGEAMTAEETRALGVAAGSSSSNLVLDDEDDMMVLLLDIGSDGRPCGGWLRQAEW
jgi:hypothetical protein